MKKRKNTIENFINPPYKNIVKLIFTKRESVSTAYYTIMIYTILRTLGEIIERNNLIKTVMHTTTSPKA